MKSRWTKKAIFEQCLGDVRKRAGSGLKKLAGQWSGGDRQHHQDSGLTPCFQVLAWFLALQQTITVGKITSPNSKDVHQEVFTASMPEWLPCDFLQMLAVSLEVWIVPVFVCSAQSDVL